MLILKTEDSLRDELYLLFILIYIVSLYCNYWINTLFFVWHKVSCTQLRVYLRQVKVYAFKIIKIYIIIKIIKVYRL